jgi:death on curing protein
MITLKDALYFHTKIVAASGGADGLRDKGGLEAALERPFSGFGDFEFYSTPEQKAAALIESIVKNHPFVDGNKRTGYVLMRMLLSAYNKDISTTEEEKYDFVINVAAGKWDYDQILDWIRKHLIDV